jgi:triacylglycerol lipase
MAPNPVVLVHGLYDTSVKFKTLAAYLENKGWSVYRLNLIPNDGTGCLKQLAQQLAEFVNHNFSPEQKIDLVGFSMGGLVTRFYLQRLGGIEHFQRYISISAPNQGTIVAYAQSLEGIKQMRPGSALIQDINQDWAKFQGQLQTTTIWTPYDLLIIPAKSSCLGLGKELSVPVWVHAWMVDDPRVWAIVAQSLSEPILPVFK